VRKLMTEGRFRHVPVLVNGKLAGIVSVGDMVKQRLDELEAEAGALRSYISTG
jgi:CBS domain-containing protein